MLIVYNFIYFLFLPLLIVRDLFVIEKNKLGTICQKLGFQLSDSKENTIWLHGVSLGEIKIIAPLAKKLRKAHNKTPILLVENRSLTNTPFFPKRKFHNQKSL